jgi:predicted metal-dependent hydrolase
VSEIANEPGEPPLEGSRSAAAQQDGWLKGVALFDAGEFWESHEALEPLWLQAEGTERHFYAGVIQLAAALHKARVQGKARGGRRNYAKALTHLALVPDRYRGVEVRELEARVHQALRSATLRPCVPLVTDDAP